MSRDGQVLSKQGEPIDEGDHVYTKIRGGRHEGDVCGATSLALVVEVLHANAWASA